MQARPKVVEPALSCAPVGASTGVESWASHLLSCKCACHSLFATTYCRPLNRPVGEGRGRLPFRDEQSPVQAKEIESASMD